MSGQEQPDSGTITLGETVAGPVDQFRDAMDNSKTVWGRSVRRLDIMKIGNTEMPPRLCRCSPSTSKAPIRANALANRPRERTFASGLVAAGGRATSCSDETDESDRYRKTCARWKTPCWSSRCAMVISHDRWFLDRIATRPYRIIGDEGKVEFFEGNFTEYEESGQERSTPCALEPKLHQVQAYCQFECRWRYPAYKPSDSNTL